jgi:DNA-binding HxlR family transcriptional regulator
MSTRYKQFCPVAKASEILSEKWTFLIIREAIMGATRFNEFQRGMALISPTMLTKRLNDLTDSGLLIRKKIPAQKGYEYHLTGAGKELFPVIKQLGDWGMRWARGQMIDSELDVELLILYLVRSIKPENLPGNETVIQFNFTNLEKLGKWWILVRENDVDACLDDPGRGVDIWFTTDLRTMIEAWMGDISYKQAIRDKRLKLVGPKTLTNNVTLWMANSIFSGIPRASEIE